MEASLAAHMKALQILVDLHICQFKIGRGDTAAVIFLHCAHDLRENTFINALSYIADFVRDMGGCNSMKNAPQHSSCSFLKVGAFCSLLTFGIRCVLCTWYSKSLWFLGWQQVSLVYLLPKADL